MPAWDGALAPLEDEVEAATARLGEIAADIEADSLTQTRIRLIEPRPT